MALPFLSFLLSFPPWPNFSPVLSENEGPPPEYNRGIPSADKDDGSNPTI